MWTHPGMCLLLWGRPVAVPAAAAATSYHGGVQTQQQLQQLLHLRPVGAAAGGCRGDSRTLAHSRPTTVQSLSCAVHQHARAVQTVP